MSLTARILIAMALGLLTGVVLNLLGNNDWLNPALQQWLSAALVHGLLDIVGQMFVASLKLLVVPLVFVSLVCGASGLGDSSRMGAIAGKTFILYIITTALALCLALLMAVLIRPGDGVGLDAAQAFSAEAAPSMKEVLISIVPSNPVQAMAEGNMLQVIVFALLVGVAVSFSGEAGQRLRGWFTDMDQVIMKMVTILMDLAPYGVFCLLAKLFAELGAGAIIELGLYFSTVLLALLLHLLGVYGLMMKFIARVNPLTFFKHLRPMLMFAFSTSSSNATLPVTLRTAEEKLGVGEKTASFTIPLGATINMDGTAIMQGVATVFIAQAYQIDIGLTGYLMVVLTATLASVGTAGVPGVGLVTLAMVLQQVNLPVEGIALIIGVDRLLDMTRTAVNVTGDTVVSVIVAQSEDDWNKDIFEQRSKAAV